jgi:RNA polymerase sigma-70 factor (ECF subfamily)
MSDLEGRFARGDEEAFNETVERYSRKVYGLCFRILRDEEEAKDMVQDVFVRAYLKRKTFKGRSSLYTWLYRIAMNMCFSHIKRRKAKTVPLEQVEGMLEARTEHETGTTIQLQNLLSRAVGSLPPKQRAVFAMRFYDKMAFKEIAEAMGTSVGAAKANHHFAVERLRQILKGADPK